MGELLAGLRQEECCALLPPAYGASRRVAFVQDRLTREETERFVEKAGEEIGVPILLPAAAARAVQALRRVMPAMPLAGSRHLVFTSVSTRARARNGRGCFSIRLCFCPFMWKGRGKDRRRSWRESSARPVYRADAARDTAGDAGRVGAGCGSARRG